MLLCYNGCSRLYALKHITHITARRRLTLSRSTRARDEKGWVNTHMDNTQTVRAGRQRWSKEKIEERRKRRRRRGGKRIRQGIRGRGDDGEERCRKWGELQESRGRRRRRKNKGRVWEGWNTMRGALVMREECTQQKNPMWHVYRRDVYMWSVYISTERAYSRELSAGVWASWLSGRPRTERCSGRLEKQKKKKS